jgi:hypothetical protein
MGQSCSREDIFVFNCVYLPRESVIENKMPDFRNGQISVPQKLATSMEHMIQQYLQEKIRLKER